MYCRHKMSTSTEKTNSGSTSESIGYPDATSLDAAAAAKMLDLPNGNRMDESWFRSHVWSTTKSIQVPSDTIIPGMQANIFAVDLADSSEPPEKRRVVVKRVVPSELPPKPNLGVWKEFVASVKREIDFYQDLKSEAYEDIRQLFPACHHLVAVDAE